MNFLPYFKPQKERSIRLFCFPYAGGGASIYARWASLLPTFIEVWPIQLPGRENRLPETAHTHLSSLVDSLKQELVPYLEEPFAFFGYSMGALIAFELCKALQPKYLPFHFFTAAYKSPQIPSVERPIHMLEEEAFLQELLKRYNKIPPEVIENQEYREIFLPSLRGDYTMIETYEYRPHPPFSFPITVFGGLQDPQIFLPDLKAWQVQTTQKIDLHMFPGDHFFIQTSLAPMLEHIAKTLRNILV